MATTVSGAVSLPDGSTLQHGRLIFTPRYSAVADPARPAAPVVADVVDGAFSISLNSSINALLYRVDAEFWSDVVGSIISKRLADIVIRPGNLVGTLASLAAVDIPTKATDAVAIDQGETLNLGLQYIDEYGGPASISGIEITAWIARDDAPRVNLTVTVLAPASGTFELSLAASATAALNGGSYALVVQQNSGARVEISTGTLIVNEVQK